MYEKKRNFVLKLRFFRMNRVSVYRTPCSTIDLATFMKPAMFAPFM